MDTASARPPNQPPDPDPAPGFTGRFWSRYRTAEFDVDGLADAASEVIAALRLSQRDARIVERPDARGIRYYQALGILARPLRYDGRQAVYGFPHLLQLAATKWLQARGLSLAQVQRALAGATMADLEAALAGARAPDEDADTAAAVTDVIARAATGTVEPRPAAPTARPATGTGEPRPAGPTAGAAMAAPEPEAGARTLVAAAMAPGVWVIIDPEHVASPADVVSHIRRSIQAFESSSPGPAPGEGGAAKDETTTEGAQP
jgi:DNA-binding transcriptional MerR regulator